MKVGNLVRPLRQPSDIKNKSIKDNPINLETLGVVIEVLGQIIKVKWPDGRTLTFESDDLEDLE